MPSDRAVRGSLARTGTPTSSHTNEGLPDFYPYLTIMRTFQGAIAAKNPLANAGNINNSDLILRLRRFPWRRPWQPTPILLPGESHGQRSLAGCSPWGQKESDTIEATQQARRRYRLQENEHAFHLEVWLSLPVSTQQSTLAPGTGDSQAFY